MTRVVLEYTTRGVVDQHEASLPANVGESQSSDDVCTDGLHLVGLAPVNVRSSGDSRGVEHVARLDGIKIGDERAAILEPA